MSAAGTVPYGAILRIEDIHMTVTIGREGGFPLVADCVTNALLWGESRTCCRGPMGGQQKQQKNSKMKRTPSAPDSGTHRTFLLPANQNPPELYPETNMNVNCQGKPRQAAQWPVVLSPRDFLEVSSSNEQLDAANP